MSSTTRSFVSPNQKYDRVVVLVDMDCFFCQVEEKLNPELKDKPMAVVQFNNWNVSGGGGIIAVNYLAREMGVTRHMRGDEAKEKCPEVELVMVPNVREKADTSRYRDAGKEVADVLQTFTNLLERASVDEAYLDITEEVLKRTEHISNGDGEVDPNLLVNTFAVGYAHIGDFIREILTSMRDDGGNEAGHYEDGLDSSTIRKSNFKLLVGAAIAGEMRAKIKEITGYECSAGIAHNKILAKLVCGINKPNKQTVLPLKEIPNFFRTLPVGKIKGLGGKFGEEICDVLKVKHLGDLKKFSEEELQRRFNERNGSWLYQICRGIDLECVTPRFYSKSIGCCKRFPGRNAITGFNTLKHWITELVTEIVERLEKDVEENNRQPRHSVISFTLEINGEDVAQSRSAPITSIDQESLEKVMMDVLKKNIDPFFKKDETAGLLNYPIKYMGISAGKFLTIQKKTVTLETMFAKQALKVSTNGKDLDVPSGSACSSTQAKDESESVKDGSHLVKEKPLEKMFEKQSQMFKEKTTEIVKPKRRPSFFKHFFTKEPEKQPTTNVEEQSLISIDEDISNPKENIEMESKESQEMKALENWFINDIGDDKPDLPVYKNEAEKKALEKLYEIQSSIDGNESFDLEKEKNTLQRLMEIKTADNSGDQIPVITEENIENLGNEEPKKPESSVKCEKCGKNIVNNEKAVQSHKDYHTALDVSRKQREEFRQEVKNKILSSKQSPPAKKPKLDTTISSIKTFFENRNPSEESTVDLQPCEECGRLIDVDKLAEHTDYHFARKVQIEMNSKDIKMVSKAKKPQQSKGKGKDSKSVPSVMKFFSQPSTSKTSIH